MVGEMGITLLQMMEQAGHHLARVAQARIAHAGSPGSVMVLAGRGHNGGGGLVAARYLHRWGVPVQVVLAAAADSYQGVPAHQLRTLRRMGIEPVQPGALPRLQQATLVIDALVGYGLRGSPRGGWLD